MTYFGLLSDRIFFVLSLHRQVGPPPLSSRYTCIQTLSPYQALWGSSPSVTLGLVDGLADGLPHRVLAAGLLQRVPAHGDCLLTDLEMVA